MLPKYHAEITRHALRNLFSHAAIEKIVAANLYQDRPAAQIGHDEFHFDNNAFKKSYAYIEEQRVITVASLQARDASSAWAAFGRLTHAVQDFYAHSNYIDLWISGQPGGTVPASSEVDPVDPTLIDHRELCSGKIYLPLEAFSFAKLLKPLVLPLLPRDSHAWMNLDSPEQGANFPFAFHAAVKRTRLEFDKTITGLPDGLVAAFADL